MKLRKIITTILSSLLISWAAVSSLGAENISISQIDNSSLLLSQEVKLYISVTDDQGKPVKGMKIGDFVLYESSDNKNYRQMKTTDFKTDANKSQGIHFLILIDNSGSMYDNLAGRPTSNPEEMRITHARKALMSFLENVKNPADTIGLAYFNTNYVHLVKQTSELSEVARAMDRIEKPETEQAYTELYAALAESAGYINTLPGRKTIVVLSDGENYSYFDKKKIPHPVHGEKIYTYEEPVELYQKEGISCYSINFGGAGDKNLDKISLESGGTVFNADDSTELENVYMSIQERILNEYTVTYKAGMEPGDRKYVKASVDVKSGKTEVTRFYFSSTLFGLPLENLNFLLLIPVALAALLWFLLTRIKFVKLNLEPNIEVLDPGPGTVVTQMVPLTQGKTVIGGSENANLTIAGISSMKDNHATIVFDEKTKSYTIISDQEIAVNNNYVKKKKLEPGDVINVEGATIVFDDEKLG